MVDLKQYQNTKTILVCRTQEEFDSISPYFKGRFSSFQGKIMCIYMNERRGSECYSELDYAMNYRNTFKFIEVSSLFNPIYELW